MQNDTHALLKLLKSDAHMQNHEFPFRYHLTPIRMVIIKKKKNQSVGKNVEKLEPSYISDRNIKWCSRCGKLNRITSKS